MKQSFEHHFRFSHPGNADESLESLNEYAIVPKSESVMKDWEEKIKSLPYYENHKVPKNAVMAYDILVSYSPDAAGTFDLEQWKKDNAEWLKNTFGEDNVLSLVYHYDEASAIETGTIHGHAIVMPIDDRGHLNSNYYVSGRDSLSDLQDSYADAMSIHGLKRGLEGSKRIDEPKKRFYARIKDAVEQPMPEMSEWETKEEYAERLKDAFRIERAEHTAENEKLDAEILRERTEIKNPELRRELDGLDEKYEALQEKDHEIIHEFGSWKKASEMANEMKELNEAIDRSPDGEKADRLADNIDRLLDWEDERKKKREKEKALELEN